jgi:transposase
MYHFLLIDTSARGLFQCRVAHPCGRPRITLVDRAFHDSNRFNLRLCTYCAPHGKILTDAFRKSFTKAIIYGHMTNGWCIRGPAACRWRAAPNLHPRIPLLKCLQRRNPHSNLLKIKVKTVASGLSQRVSIAFSISSAPPLRRCLRFRGAQARCCRLPLFGFVLLPQRLDSRQ